MQRYHYLWLALVVSLYLLHVLRNLSVIFAFAAPFFCMLGAFFFFLKRKDFVYDLKGVAALSAFAFTSFLPVLLSLLWYPEEDYANAYMRYFFIVPYVFFSIYALDRFEALELVLRVYVFFIFFGAVTMFYQVFFGPISWFAEPSEREGLVRFSSLVGSLTAYGVYAAFAVPVILIIFKNGLLKFVLFFVTISGMLMTLQKAAVMNLLVLVFLAILFERGGLKIAIKLLLVAMPVVFSALYFDLGYISSTIDNVVRFGSDSGATDVSVYQSILDRIWMLPSELYKLHGGFGMLMGVGLVGGSGTLGFPDFPMAHNGFFDLLFIGGVANLLGFLALFTAMYIRIFRLSACVSNLDSPSKAVVVKACKYIGLLFLANFLFAGVLYFQPYGGVIFYSMVAFFVLRGGAVYGANASVSIQSLK